MAIVGPILDAVNFTDELAKIKTTINELEFILSLKELVRSCEFSS